MLIDAKNQILGRVAVKAAGILRGKSKPTYTPHVDCGDNVIVINAGEVKLSGKKWEDKVYYRHTGYPGGIKSLTAQQIKDRKPQELLQKAVRGMLPKTRLGRLQLGNFRVYVGEEHPHRGQNPSAPTA